MAQWITRLPTEQKIAGSSPAEIVTLLVGVSIFNHFVNKKMEIFKTSATSGNRTRAARVAGEHSTTEPTLLCESSQYALNSPVLLVLDVPGSIPSLSSSKKVTLNMLQNCI